MKMILFPFSLDDKAACWERHIPSSKVSTWADVKTEFLKQFFPVQKTARFRVEIQSFKQKGNETLSEAWERLKGFTRSCPHHGVTKENLLGIFYRGVHNEIRRSLDIASNGNFASLTCEQAETLIDNLAQSEACYGGEYDRSSIGVVSSTMNSGQLKGLEEKIDKLTRVLETGQRNVSYVDDYNHGPSQETYHEAYFQQAQSGSSQAQNETNAMLKQLVDDLAQTRLARSEDQKEMQRRFDVMEAEMARMRSQQASSSSKQPMSSFPSTNKENPRANCNVILNGNKGEEVKTSQSHIDDAQLEENERFLKDFAKLLDSPIDEKVAKGDQGPINGFKSDRTKRIRQDQVETVKHVLKVDTKVEKAKQHVVPEATTPKSKKKKLEEAKSVSHEVRHPSLTFEPLRFIDGKIECKVVCKGRSKPFAKARILIPPDSKTNDVGVITDPTALAFNIKLDDRGPYHEVPLQFPYA